RWGLTASYGHRDLVGMTVVWALLDCFILGLGVRAVLRRLHARQSYRFPVAVAAQLGTNDGQQWVAQTTNLSRYGARLCVETGHARVDADVEVTLDLPDGALVLPAVV